MENTYNNRVLVVGSVAQDTIQTLAGKRENVLGGAGVFFSYACSFFAPVEMVGVVGDDFLPEHLRLLEDRHIDIRSLKKVKGKTFHWEGIYSDDFNTAHTLKTKLNVFADFKGEILPDQQRIKYLFLANIEPALQLKVASQMEDPDLIATDTMNYWIDGKREELLKVLRITEILLINDSEAKQLGEDANLARAAYNILSLGPKVLIVKRGEYGAMMFCKDKRNKLKIFSAPAVLLDRVVDPTGAGDSFAGAFIGYLASCGRINEDNLRVGVVLGCAVASFIVEGFSLDGLKGQSINTIYRRFNSIREISHFDEMIVSKVKNGTTD